MKLIIGLGNPGKKYAGTRHNTGFQVLNALKARISNDKFLISKQIQSTNFKYQKRFQSEILRFENVVLAKPQTFMNKSGEAVAKIVRFYKVQLNEVYVVHDDLDIDLGKYKIQKGKGPKVHGGLGSVYEELGSKGFWHVRVGIENRFREATNRKSQFSNNNDSEVNVISGERYVLQRFNEIEQEALDRVIGEVVEELLAEVED